MDSRQAGMTGNFLVIPAHAGISALLAITKIHSLSLTTKKPFQIYFETITGNTMDSPDNEISIK